MGELRFPEHVLNPVFPPIHVDEEVYPPTEPSTSFSLAEGTEGYVGHRAGSFEVAAGNDGGWCGGRKL